MADSGEKLSAGLAGLLDVAVVGPDVAWPRIGVPLRRPRTPLGRAAERPSNRPLRLKLSADSTDKTVAGQRCHSTTRQRLDMARERATTLRHGVLMQLAAGRLAVALRTSGVDRRWVLKTCTGIVEKKAPTMKKLACWAPVHDQFVAAWPAPTSCVNRRWQRVAGRCCQP